MNAPIQDCTADWPSDPDNEQLAQFAQRLEADLPTLSDGALARVGQAMRQEMARVSPAPVRRIPFVRMALAASVLICVGVASYFLASREHQRPENPAPVVIRQKELPPSDTTVFDNFPVSTMSPAEPPLPQKPILQLDENSSLFQK